MSNALTLPALSIDSLEHFSRAIKQYPLLSAEEEYELASRFKQENDLDAARQIRFAQRGSIEIFVGGRHAQHFV